MLNGRTEELPYLPPQIRFNRIGLDLVSCKGQARVVTALAYPTCTHMCIQMSITIHTLFSCGEQNTNSFNITSTTIGTCTNTRLN